MIIRSRCKVRFCYVLMLVVLLGGCSRTCYIQEVEPGSINGSYEQPQARNGTGFERYQRLLARLHHEGACKQVGPASKVNVFKLRFCNYMLGYRNDDKNALIAMAKEISDYYKKVRLYDLARTFDSYRDVLLFGNETIAESWDDTMDLLEEFQNEIDKAKCARKCAKKKERENNQSFFAKLFGGGKKSESSNSDCNCQWTDSGFTSRDRVAIPSVLSEPPGSCSPKNPLLFKRLPNYDACLGLPQRSCAINAQPQMCAQCPINTGDRTINAAKRYVR